MNIYDLIVKAKFKFSFQGNYKNLHKYHDNIVKKQKQIVGIPFMSSNVFFVVVLKKHLQSGRVHAYNHDTTCKNNGRVILHLSFVILSNCHNISGIYNCRQN